MPPRLCEIRSKITSNDTEVLRHSLGFVQERLREEQDRGKAAETRAVAVLAILGILAGSHCAFCRHDRVCRGV